MKKKRQQMSTDNVDEYRRQQRIFDGAPDIVSHAASQEYRRGFDRIDWSRRYTGKEQRHG